MQLLLDYSIYNHWANTRMAEWLRQAPEEILFRETASSFPTLYDTLTHIWGAEDIWLRRLHGESPSRFLGSTFKGTAEELFSGLVANSLSFVEFLTTRSADFYTETCRYQTTDGKLHAQPNAGIILHCIQHSTFHRGQLITMGRALGLTDPPKTDYIVYLRENQGTR